jgi:hypothetical protein
MGWKKQPPGYGGGSGWSWLGAIPDPLGCFSYWALSVALVVAIVLWLLW